MKKIKFILTGFVAVFFLSCHDLEVPVENALTSANFPIRTEHFIQASGPTYTNFRGSIALSYWFLQSLSTDESILPARGGNWYDGARYFQLHQHNWNPDNGQIDGTWNWITGTITTINQNIAVVETAPESPAKQQGLAELKAMRAIAYWIMLDLWGNVPLLTKFGVTEKPTTTPKKDIYAFIEKEVLEAIPNLSGDVNAATYGRPTKFVGYALLAKLYINSEVYIGQKRYDDVVKMCDIIIGSKKFALESNFVKVFDIDNGPQIKETIFAVPFDNIAGGQFLARYYLHRAMRAKYEIPFTPSGAISVQEEFLVNFNEEDDVRTKMLLKGRQFLNNGAPIVIKTTKRGFDQDYKEADASATIDYHLELVPKLEYRNLAAFDLGNDEKAWAQGYRYAKFFPDKTSTTRNQGNDFPFFRYSDVLLMKAEAIMRGAAATNGDTPLAIVNTLRKIRNASELKELNLDIMLAERGREFCNENWRRNDLIRFGKFEGKWGLKTDTDPNKRLYPIPRSILNINPKLTQNPGY